MVLDTQTIENIMNSIKLAKLFEVESLIVEPHVIRGINSKSTAAIFTECTNNIGCAAAGINRFDVLGKRLTLVDPIDASIELEYEDEEDEATMIRIKSKKLNIAHRCGTLRTITAPKSLAVKPMYKVEFTDELYKTLSSAKQAMKTDEVLLLSDDGNVCYEFIDQSDKLQYFDGTAVNIDDEFKNVNFIIKFPLKFLLHLINGLNVNEFFIMEKEMIHGVVDGVGIYIPKKK
jgi:hypothetical protein